MPEFEVRRYTQEIGKMRADSIEDAALLLRYGHGPTMWQHEGARLRLVNPDKTMVRNIDDYRDDDKS